MVPLITFFTFVTEYLKLMIYHNSIHISKDVDICMYVRACVCAVDVSST